MFRRVLIVNRGAIARRVVRACSALGIDSVAVYSDADTGAPHLDEAGTTWRLPGFTASETYLNVPLLLEALLESGADAVHPGYGFLAENAAFARAVVDAGATFIGPSPEFLETMGDKVRARALAAELGLPVFPGSQRVAGIREALTLADEIGYPVLVKPAAGGGGIGMEVATNAAELERALGRAGQLARRAFGDEGVYLERRLDRVRHIEIQVLGDRSGNAMHTYERDCSIQRRHQKVIEEAPAPGIGRAEIEALCTRAVEFVKAIGYDSVGTVEMLRLASGEYGFLEMNTRIQVEHGVTEEALGVDLVRAQILLAAGETVESAMGSGEPPALARHAIEARIYAEDPERLLPSTGRLSVFRAPCLHGVRVDTGYQAGQWVTPYYDPLLAKVIATAPTRELAVGRLQVAIRAFEIQGVLTNAPLLRAVLESESFLAGEIDTAFLNRFMGPVQSQED